MKKLTIITFLLVLSIDCFAQKQKVSIDTLDLMIDNNKATLKKELTLFLNNADDKYVPVKVYLDIDKKIYEEYKPKMSDLHRFMMLGYYGAMYSCKNKYTFSPKKIFIWYYDKYNVYNVNVEFTAQNDYGATKDGRYSKRFDIITGEEIKLSELIKREERERENKSTEKYDFKFKN